MQKWVEIECIMRKTDINGNVILLVGYFVDDLVIAGKVKEVDRIMKSISQRFKCTITDFDDNSLKNILGIDIRINENSIELCQNVYIEKLGERFDIKCIAYVTPLEPNFYFQPWYKELEYGSK